MRRNTIHPTFEARARTLHTIAIGALAASTSLFVACRPEIGNAPSLVQSPRLLTLASTPAVAAPGAMVQIEALAVDPSGTLATPIGWSICKTPKPPAETNSVSRTCVDQPDDAAPAAGPTTVTIPADACALFGPIPPPMRAGQPAVRPRDPDATGGYFLPVRATARDVADAFGPPMAFALVRISCGLSNAPAEDTAAYRQRYKANQAPGLAGVDVLDSADQSIGDSVTSETKIRLRATWTEGDVETFPAFNIADHVLEDLRESIGISWFATAGEFLHDRTGRDANAVETTSDNDWTAPKVDRPTVVHFWVVIRDIRGGTGYKAFDLTVAPR